MAKKKKAAKAKQSNDSVAAELPIQSIKVAKPKKGKRKKMGKKKPIVMNAVTLFTGTGAIKPRDPATFPDSYLDTRRSMRLLATIPNIRCLLEHYGISVRYDVIGKEADITVPGQTGCQDNWKTTAEEAIRSLVNLNWIPSAGLTGFLTAIANRNAFNPAADWILSKPWDCKDRLEGFYSTLQAQDSFPPQLRDILMYRWIISAVAAAMLPSGFTARGVLVLQGAQSIGKTRWVMSLIPDQALQEQLIKLGFHLDASNKDSILTAVRHWIVEIGELDSSMKKDVARLKAFITESKDKIRVPFGKSDSVYSRRTVFCATVNRPDFLVDDTGNTRWWTIPVTRADYEHGIDMQQLFAQVYEEHFCKDEDWWLDEDEEELLEQCNSDHQHTTAIQELIEAKVDFSMKSSWSKEPIRNAGEILDLLGIEHPTNPQVKECGVVLTKHLGDRKKSNGKNGWRIKFGEPVEFGINDKY